MSVDRLPIDERTNEMGRQVFDIAFVVHRELGPGLLESTYVACLRRELSLRGLDFRVEVPVPVVYKGCKLDAGYRIDLLIENCVVVEAKAIDALAPIHEAQLLTYLKLSGPATWIFDQLQQRAYQGWDQKTGAVGTEE